MEIDVVEDVVFVRGQVDARHTLELRSALYDAIGGHSRDVALDLRDVESIDVTALRVIAVASREMGEQTRGLRLRHCPPRVRRLLHLTHLRGLVLFDTAV